MGYVSMEQCVRDLEKNGHLVRITEEVDPYLEMAAIHHRVFQNEGPALLFERVKGSQFRAVSNLFGSLDRSRFLFRDTLETVKRVVELKGDPSVLLKNPFRYVRAPWIGWSALPRKVSRGPVTDHTCEISDLPQIVHWPMDGGPFVTLPIVHTEDIDRPGPMGANIGMYRIQLGGNEYIPNREIGLHYQLHRGIGVHQTKAHERGEPLRVSIFVGGPPSHTFSAVMPLPEGLSELTFAGALGNRRFRYTKRGPYTLSTDADFVITGYVEPGAVKPEGPFGDHLGYYSLQHPFPLMKVEKVYHRTNAIWPFTVVGRPPQEDTQFGALIHEITGSIIPSEIPGLHAVHAVDASGVHPLLLAQGSERYTPYLEKKRPQELLTIANAILGYGQMSLAKYLFIIDRADQPNLDIHDVEPYFQHVLERIDLQRDLHFHTQTSMDTLDYSGESINAGSKLVVAAVGAPRRELGREVPSDFPSLVDWKQVRVALPGVLVMSGAPYESSDETRRLVHALDQALNPELEQKFPLIIWADDAQFTAATLNNWLWVTFTRSNPSHDIHGIQSSVTNKHWGCRGPMIIDARIKPHHAPAVELDPEVEKRVDRLGAAGASLHGII